MVFLDSLYELWDEKWMVQDEGTQNLGLKYANLRGMRDKPPKAQKQPAEAQRVCPPL